MTFRSRAVKPKVTARSTNTPPLSGAEAFARLLVAAMAKKPELKVVEKNLRGITLPASANR